MTITIKPLPREEVEAVVARAMAGMLRDTGARLGDPIGCRVALVGAGFSADEVLRCGDRAIEMAGDSRWT